MGLTDSLLLQLAKKLIGPTIKSVTDLSNDQKKALEAAYNQGKTDAEEKNKTTIQSSPSSITVGEQKPAGALDFKGLFSDAAQGVGAATKPFQSLETVENDVNALIAESQKLANTMGLGRARAGELKSTIADTLPEMVKLGMTTDDSIKVISDIPTALKTNASVANETIVELGATSKFTGQSVKDLVDGFSKVGTQLSSVGDEMAGVANYAKSVGTNVNAVTGLVVSNLKQVNLFNFENGVQGLGKMAAQSAMLGVNMNNVFQKAESLLNPESAIEFTSALQRLGVTSTELLDPLSAMDMALNDPAKLQDEMTKVAKQFTRLKADGTGFEILPGAKLQLREVAKELGMSADELAGMAIKSSDLDMKLKQIRFPSFAASEEDRMLIANMSQMKDGRAVVQITDEKGEKKEVAVEDLTAQQLEDLKKEQANQNKSAEEIARDQLSVQERIEGILKGTELSARMGVASTGTLQRAATANLTLRESSMENLYGKIQTKDVRGAVSDVTQPIENSIVSLFTDGGLSDKNISNISTELLNIPGNLAKKMGDLTIGALTGLESGVKQGVSNVSNIYSGVGGLKPINQSEVSTEYITKIKEFVESGVKNFFSESKVEKNLNVQQKVDFTNSDGSLKNLSPELYNALFNKLISDPKDLKTLSDEMDKVSQGI